jgi:hypothetical protein
LLVVLLAAVVECWKQISWYVVVVELVCIVRFLIKCEEEQEVELEKIDLEDSTNLMMDGTKR